VLGVGQPATTGRRYRALHNGSALELVSAHDHGYIYEPLAGKQWKVRENSFYADLCDARSLAKPFVATESGVAVEWVSGNLVQRAELFRAKLDAFFDAGGAGYILWNYEPEPDTNFGFGPTDPVLPMLREVAARL
jgi:hypothetical protein